MRCSSIARQVYYFRLFLLLCNLLYSLHEVIHAGNACLAFFGNLVVENAMLIHGKGNIKFVVVTLVVFSLDGPLTHDDHCIVATQHQAELVLEHPRRGLRGQDGVELEVVEHLALPERVLFLALAGLHRFLLHKPPLAHQRVDLMLLHFDVEVVLQLSLHHLV